MGCATRACSGNRCEAVDVMAALLTKGVAVFTFDFLGCGQSDGDFITLGVGVGARPYPPSIRYALKSEGHTNGAD